MVWVCFAKEGVLGGSIPVGEGADRTWVCFAKMGCGGFGGQQKIRLVRVWQTPESGFWRRRRGRRRRRRVRPPILEISRKVPIPKILCLTFWPMVKGQSLPMGSFCKGVLKTPDSESSTWRRAWGISLMKRLMRVGWRTPRVVRQRALDKIRCSWARVIPTKQSLRSSSTSLGFSSTRAWGRIISSRPTMATTGNSRPLALWRVMRATARVSGEAIEVGDEGDAGEVVGEVAFGVALVVLGGRADEFFDVLDGAVVAFGVVFLGIEGFQPGLADDLVDQERESLCFGGGDPAFELGGELLDGLDGGRAEVGDFGDVLHGLPEGPVFVQCPVEKLLLGLI